ncbi:noncanonical pyrimidine nucleotidase, YjjG family [Flavobacteriaceae bacterium AU392]|nr:noncanonical pyrimidine nucleotidase, YjjG family [Flavobacteriaceae bacterium]RKM81366.1 noncanonical pyrimidine nucleotidase, YjjG family [Flavobacteriaceae bacterium AU392]
MKIKNIEHIFFDLDHTLWDFDKNSGLTFEKIFKLNDLDIDIKEFLKVYEPINFQYWKLFREDKIDKVKLRFNRLYDTFNHLNINIKSSMIYKLSKDYISHLTSFNHLFDGAIDVLEYLKPNYKLHIITNGFKEVQQSKLNKSNIDHYFDVVINSEMVGVKKPNPKIFKHALLMTNASLDNSIMIGDNYEADVLGAINFGMDAICYNYHNESLSKNIKEVNHLIEIRKYL